MGGCCLRDTNDAPQPLSAVPTRTADPIADRLQAAGAGRGWRVRAGGAVEDDALALPLPPVGFGRRRG